MKKQNNKDINTQVDIKNLYHDLQTTEYLPHDVKKSILLVLDDIKLNGMTQQNQAQLTEYAFVIKQCKLEFELGKLIDYERKRDRPNLNFKFVQSLLYFVENYTMEEDVKKDIKVIIKDLIKIKGNIDRDYKNDLIDFFETLIRNVEQFKPNKRIYDLTQEQQQAEIVDEDERNEEKENYYTDFITSKVKNKKWLNKQTIYKIHKTPTKTKQDQETHYKASKKDAIHQIDILFLPSDNQFQYLLVICDVYTGLIDGVPLRNKNSDVVLKASQTIYKRNILNQPFRIICDSGGEFKSVFKSWCDDNNIMLNSLESGKHIGMIDSKIKMIGNAVLKLQTSQELLTKKEKTGWVEDAPKIIELINKYTVKKDIKHAAIPYDSTGDIPDTIMPKDGIVPIGTTVRKILFKPKNVMGKNLSGKFRSADVRFNPEISVITNFLMTPGSPVMYLIDGSNQPYARNEFQIIEDNEEKPPKSVLKNKKTYLKEFEDELKKKK